MSADARTFPAQVTVVIPTWNGRALLPACLDALLRQTRPPAEIVVVDNGSEDGTAELLCSAYPEVRVVSFPRNRGFASAANAGIRASRTPFVALLNNDAVPEPGWIAALLDATDRHPRGAAFCSLVLTPAGRVESTGLVYTRYGWAVQRDHLGDARDAGVGREAVVHAAPAAAILYRLRALDGTLLFEDDFFAYAEDIDLSFQLRRAGWECRYVPEARVVHAGSATAIRMGSMRQVRSLWNQLRLPVRHFDGRTLLRALPQLMLGALLWAAAALRRGEGSAFRAIAAFLLHLPDDLRARKRLARRLGPPVAEIWEGSEQILPRIVRRVLRSAADRRPASRREPCPVCGRRAARAMLHPATDWALGTPDRFRWTRCASCRAFSISPYPPEREVASFYDSPLYTPHATPVLAHGETEASALDRLRRQYAIGRKAFLPPAPAGGRLLEIGCGNGGYLFLMRRLGWDVVGVESAPDVARIARDSLGLDVRAGTLEASSFPDAHFHCVALHHSFEHLHAPSAALREVRRILRPGGVIAIACPNARSLVHRLLGRFCMSWDPPRHLQMFTAPSLRRLVEGCGFKVLRITTPTRMAAYMLLNSLRFRRLAPRRGVGFWSVRPGDPQVPFAWRWSARLTAAAEAFTTIVGIPLGEELCLVARRPSDNAQRAREAP